MVRNIGHRKRTRRTSLHNAITPCLFVFATLLLVPSFASLVYILSVISFDAARSNKLNLLLIVVNFCLPNISYAICMWLIEQLHKPNVTMRPSSMILKYIFHHIKHQRKKEEGKKRKEICQKVRFQKNQSLYNISWKLFGQWFRFCTHTCELHAWVLEIHSRMHHVHQYDEVANVNSKVKKFFLVRRILQKVIFLILRCNFLIMLVSSLMDA